MSLKAMSPVFVPVLIYTLHSKHYSHVLLLPYLINCSELIANLKAPSNEHNLTENNCCHPNKQCQKVSQFNFGSLLTKYINKVSSSSPFKNMHGHMTESGSTTCK